MMMIEPKHVGALLMQILIFFQSNSIVHQLANKYFGSIKMHGIAVKLTCMLF